MRASRLSLAVLASCLLSTPASANDSEAEVAVGGLTLKPSANITLDSEDLFISRDEVRVQYQFTNASAQDITATVAFPLPDMPTGDGEAGAMVDYRRSLDFKTNVDGKPATLDFFEQALRDGRDVSARLRASGIPLNAGVDGFDRIINALAPGQRQALIHDGFIEEAGSDGNPIWTAKWILKSTVTRQQIFPAGATIKVEHRYKPIVGGSVAGALERQYRDEEWARSQIKKYCIEDSWFAAFDRMQEKQKPNGEVMGYSELWLGYILKSGANWKGPIRKFRLVVDKGHLESLVSFCAGDVKKISPTQLEVRKTDFEPADDLNILIIDWAGER